MTSTTISNGWTPDGLGDLKVTGGLLEVIEAARKLV